MSVKAILPILGVGSAFALLGLAAARQKQNQRARQDNTTRGERRLESGVHPSVALADDEPESTAFAPVELTREFWDAAPESSALLDGQGLLDSQGRPEASLDAYDALDTEDLSAAWLARATEAPAFDDALDTSDLDDPAEIAADSLSMISDASRRAAGVEIDEEQPPSEFGRT